MKYDQAVANVLNFNTLPVLVAMFINRDALKKEIYEQTKSNDYPWYKIVMFNKNQFDSLKQKALKVYK